jgi:hypothetical protein
LSGGSIDAILVRVAGPYNVAGALHRTGNMFTGDQKQAYRSLNINATEELVKSKKKP